MIYQPESWIRTNLTDEVSLFTTPFNIVKGQQTPVRKSMSYTTLLLRPDLNQLPSWLFAGTLYRSITALRHLLIFLIKELYKRWLPFGSATLLFKGLLH